MLATLNLRNTDDELVLKLQRVKSQNLEDFSPYTWEGRSGTTWLRIFELADGAAYKVEKSEDIISKDEDIISQYNEFKADLIEKGSSGIEILEENLAPEPVSLPYPYDPDLIRVDPKPFNVSLVKELIEIGDIDLAPEFQRHFVWKDIGQRSRLIESMMLRIPLPVFYMAQDREGKFQVVDGLQRLTVVNQFLNNEFKLRDLEYLKDCEGKYYKREGSPCIDAKYTRRITQTQFIFNVIDPQTPTRVKFDIFKRINQGGKPLKSQEIRNCMASARSRQLIKELASSDLFRKATGYSINATRMEDQELILRFIAFYFVEQKKKPGFKYVGNMDFFLDDTLDTLNAENDSVYSDIRAAFYRAMSNAYHLFGGYAFRKCTLEHLKPGARRQFINKSLFTSWSVVLSQYNTEDILRMEPNMLNIPLAEEIESNDQYYDFISAGTNDVARISFAFTTARRLCSENLKDII